MEQNGYLLTKPASAPQQRNCVRMAQKNQHNVNSLLFPSIERDLEHFPGYRGEHLRGQTHLQYTDASATAAADSKDSIYLRTECGTALFFYLISGNNYGPQKEKNKGFFAVTIPNIQLCSSKVNIGPNFLLSFKLAPK